MDGNININDLITSPTILVIFTAFIFLPLIFYYLREPELPGTVKRIGTWEHPDVTDESQMEERKRDFFRCAKSKEGILVSVDGDIKPLFAEDVEDYDGALKIFDAWLEKNGIKIKAEKIVPLLSVTPGFDFLMSHKIPPMTKQGTFMILGGVNEVRVLWSAFTTDSPQPNQIAGPFILDLLSEDLVAKKGTRTHFDYSMKSNSQASMKNVFERHRMQLAKAARGDKSALIR